MRGTLVFVHGTGVRDEGFQRTFAEVTKRATSNGFDGIEIVPCSWGAVAGAPTDEVPLALPLEAAPTAAALDLSDSAGAWSLLVDDPLFELRLVAEGPRRTGAVVPGQLRAGPAAIAMVKALSVPEAISADLLERLGISGAELAAAAAEVAGASELEDAATAAGNAVDPDLVRAIARAVVARVLAAHRLDPPGVAPELAFDPELRGELVGALAAALAPPTAGLTGWIARAAGGFVARRATSAIEARRLDVSSASSPGVADILYYQRRGDAIRAFVERSLHGHERPIVAVGHSLGGVILVDVLSQADAPPVDLLVTAGSQAPMFYAVDALASLRPGQPTAPFTPWLNIYSSDDFLSFCATRIFGDEGITDVEIDAGVPFPEAHSAYWRHDPTYEIMRQHWPS